jgi:hypothetical protein
MASLLEEFNAMKIKVAAAQAKGDQAALNEKVHVVFHSAERKRKATNPTGSTRIMLNCRTPEQWKEFQMAKEVYFEEAVDPHIAVDLMIRALTAFSRETIRGWAKDGQPEAGPPPPKAEIPELPDFLRD